MKKSAGFGVVGLIIALAALVIICVVAWRVWDANKKQTTSSSNTSPTQDATTYLDIKELGVRIKLDDKTNDERYRYGASSNGKGDYAVIINEEMKSIDNDTQYCSGEDAGLIGSLERSKDPYYFYNSERAIVVDNKTSFKLGDYYFVFQPPQAECSQDSSIGQKRIEHQQNFVNVLKTVQSTSP